MALPEILMPSSLPVWRRAPHEQSLHDPYATVPNSTGARRRRRVYTTVPKDVRCELMLSPTQAALFDSWFEQVLFAGTEAFSARFQPLGDGPLEWWAARFLEPYQAEPQRGGRGWWRISALLRLTGEASATPPVVTSMYADILIPLQGTASIEADKVLAADILVPLLGGASTGPMAASILVPLDGSAAPERDVRITSTGETRVTSDGHRRIVSL